MAENINSDQKDKKDEKEESDEDMQKYLLQMLQDGKIPLDKCMKLISLTQKSSDVLKKEMDQQHELAMKSIESEERKRIELMNKEHIEEMQKVDSFKEGCTTLFDRYESMYKTRQTENTKRMQIASTAFDTENKIVTKKDYYKPWFSKDPVLQKETPSIEKGSATEEAGVLKAIIDSEDKPILDPNMLKAIGFKETSQKRLKEN